MSAPSLRNRFRATLSRLLLGPGAGQPVIHAIPITTFSPRRDSRAVLDAYAEDAWFQAVVDTVADPIAASHFRVFKPNHLRTPPGSFKTKALRTRLCAMNVQLRTKELEALVSAGDWIELEDHELLRILYAPHPDYPGQSCLKLLAVYRMLPGEAFLWLRRSATGTVVGYEPIPPHCVSMTPTPQDPHYFISYNQFAGRVHASEVVWLKGLDPRNPVGRGLGRGSALADELDTNAAIQSARKATFKRGGLPAAVVGVDEGPAGEDRAEELQAEYEERFGKPESAGRVWFVSGKTTLSQIQQDFRALQMDEAARALGSLVRQVFNVPPGMMGDSAAGTRASAEEEKYTLADRAIAPWQDKLVVELNHGLVPRVDPEAIIVAKDPRPESWERTFKVMAAAPNEGVSWNEVRALGGLPPDPALEGKRPRPLPGAQPVLDTPATPANPPPPRGDAERR
ncbi:phage portal protein [Archangium lansingense]|uniref:Phage portal protein n=1 Tax=Archangium lansingense TaxID=2995310 RepID=A0ABT4AHB4_9BACT|nr:phage portal protein [Archangium lansinium]MCY1080289.1 phage portal protein [Archangium lansinium]